MPGEDPSPRAQAVLRTARVIFSILFVGCFLVVAYLSYLLIRG